MSLELECRKLADVFVFPSVPQTDSCKMSASAQRRTVFAPVLQLPKESLNGS